MACLWDPPNVRPYPRLLCLQDPCPYSLNLSLAGPSSPKCLPLGSTQNRGLGPIPYPLQ